MPATIYKIATTGAMLMFEQEPPRENAALAAEPGRNGDSNVAKVLPGRQTSGVCAADV
jgi:hypothetical protein